MSKLPRPIKLSSPAQRELVASYVLEAAPAGAWVEFKPDRRSIAQNRLMWDRLHQLSREVPWDGERLSAEEYKDLLTACLRKQKVVRGIEGGLVFLGQRSSTMTKAEMGELLDLMDAFAAERGVIFQDTREMQR